jgi:nucleoside-diphosphate-sugar epimerase
METTMKIVVIGGTGLIGSKVMNKLRDHGHEAIAASHSGGINTVTGEGLAGVLKGASVVVDASDSPSYEDAAVLKFFEDVASRNANVFHEPVNGIVVLRSGTKNPRGF